MALATLLTAPEKVADAEAMSGRLLPEVLTSAAPRAARRGKRALIVPGGADDRLGVHRAGGRASSSNSSRSSSPTASCRWGMGSRPRASRSSRRD
jgi:hypothetical protein